MLGQLQAGSYRTGGGGGPPTVKGMGIGTEVTFTIRSSVALWLSLVLFVEEPWRMKLRLNVLMVVTEDASSFSATRKPMRISVTQRLDRLLGKKGQVSRLPGVCSGPGVSFWAAGLTVDLFCVYFYKASLAAFWEKVAWR